MNAPLKLKTCAVKTCKAEFIPFRPMQKVCSPKCAQTIAEAKSERERAKKEQEERRETRAKLERLKTKSDRLNEAQVEFNRYIRERDRDLPCISCGRHHTGSYDAGHYRSVGAAPQLRFDEDNCHKQCVPCNQFKSGNAIEYRLGLVRRIGQSKVMRLEATNGTLNLTIDDIKQIKAIYKAKYKALKESRND